jgi:hypothetical protein
LFFMLAILFAGSFVAANEQEWPKEYFMDGAKIVMYQPQLETFEGNKMTARAAVSVTKKNAEPVFCAMWLKARVVTDRFKYDYPIHSIHSN